MTTTSSIAFVAGLLSFLSPCVLPLIPGYISYISGTSYNKLVERKKNCILITGYMDYLLEQDLKLLKFMKAA